MPNVKSEFKRPPHQKFSEGDIVFDGSDYFIVAYVGNGEYNLIDLSSGDGLLDDPCNLDALNKNVSDWDVCIVYEGHKVQITLSPR
jgi:hypothetical protein